MPRELAQEEVGVVGEIREKERTTKWADVRGNEEMEEAEGQRVGTEKKTEWMELLDVAREKDVGAAKKIEKVKDRIRWQSGAKRERTEFGMAHAA